MVCEQCGFCFYSAHDIGPDCPNCGTAFPTEDSVIEKVRRLAESIIAVYSSVQNGPGDDWEAQRACGKVSVAEEILEILDGK